MSNTTVHEETEEFDGLTLVDLLRFSQRLGVDPGRIMALVPDERAPIVRAVNNVRRAAELLEEAVAAESEIGDDQADAYAESVRPHLMRVAAFLSGEAVEEVQA